MESIDISYWLAKRDDWQLPDGSDPQMLSPYDHARILRVVKLWDASKWRRLFRWQSAKPNLASIAHLHHHRTLNSGSD
jgi:hypothetical protein